MKRYMQRCLHVWFFSVYALFVMPVTIASLKYGAIAFGLLLSIYFLLNYLTVNKKITGVVNMPTINRIVPTQEEMDNLSCLIRLAFVSGKEPLDGYYLALLKSTESVAVAAFKVCISDQEAAKKAFELRAKLSPLFRKIEKENVRNFKLNKKINRN
jgi:hypothetical protein